MIRNTAVVCSLCKLFGKHNSVINSWLIELQVSILSEGKKADIVSFPFYYSDYLDKTLNIYYFSVINCIPRALKHTFRHQNHLH